MSKDYSQFRALLAIMKASFKAIFAQPSSLFFSLVFPIVFILIFGSFGKGSAPVYKVALDPGSDTTNAFFHLLKQSTSFTFSDERDTTAINSELKKGKLTAALFISAAKDTAMKQYQVSVRSTSASSDRFDAFMQALDYTRLRFDAAVHGFDKQAVIIEEPQVSAGTKYRQIDFILPGQIGFSIMFATLFGIAFTFFNLREQLVLKRFYASPVRRLNILIGIGTSRLFFQLVNVVVLVLFGYFFLQFTLQNGWFTFIDIVLLSVYMLFLLMGQGLIISSIARNDSNIPLLINLIGFPQMLLSGTFFPITVFPAWLQKICMWLPLTQFNEAMRKISFEGLHLTDCGKELGILALWVIVTYALLARLIRWE